MAPTGRKPPAALADLEPDVALSDAAVRCASATLASLPTSDGAGCRWGASHVGRRVTERPARADPGRSYPSSGLRASEPHLATRLDRKR